MKGEVDKSLREEQAGFRQGRSCTDQIATLRIIVEQSIEWNSSLNVNFVDYEKAFDSLDGETLLENITTLWGAHDIGQHDQNLYVGMSESSMTVN